MTTEFSMLLRLMVWSTRTTWVWKNIWSAISCKSIEFDHKLKSELLSFCPLLSILLTIGRVLSNMPLFAAFCRLMKVSYANQAPQIPGLQPNSMMADLMSLDYLETTSFIKSFIYSVIVLWRRRGETSKIPRKALLTCHRETKNVPLQRF